MYAIRYFGMFVRKDGLMSNSKSSALLFDTVEEAQTYVTTWRTTSGVHIMHAVGELPIPGQEIEIVEAKVKIIMQSAGKVVCTL